MAMFDRATYILKLAKNGLATNGFTGETVNGTGTVFTFDDLSLNGTASELIADDSILGGRGVSWLFHLNGQERITGTSLKHLVGSSNDDVIDMTGTTSTNGYNGVPILNLTGGYGDDTIWAGNLGNFTIIYGDIDNSDQSAVQQGGDDNIVGSFATDAISGDFDVATGTTAGGDDVIRAVGSEADTVHGDVKSLLDGTFTGGADVIFGGYGDNILYGDFDNVGLHAGATAEGGDDEIHGGEGDDEIYGDIQDASAAALRGYELDLIGGDDILFGDAGNDKIYGDALIFEGDAGSSFVGGNDTINGGAGDDELWGDLAVNNASGGATVTLGADTFVFDGMFGDDIIKDFVSGSGDKIDLSALGVTKGDIDSNNDDVVDAADTPRVDVDTDGVFIVPTDDDTDGTILVEGVSSLVVDDFIFAV